MQSLLALGLAALASASPLPTFSEGFKLQIQLDHPSQDFTPPVHNKYVVGVHISAGWAMVTPAPHHTEYATFHTNGTDADLWAARGTVVAGFGRYAQSWRTERSADDDDANLWRAMLRYGGAPGTEGVRVIDQRGDLMLGPGQYMVCDRRLPYGLAVELGVRGGEAAARVHGAAGAGGSGGATGADCEPHALQEQLMVKKKKKKEDKREWGGPGVLCLEACDDGAAWDLRRVCWGELETHC
ncbi:hypothetical protein BBAD15_g11170 [Beauveria bassiana D1-5]|uniref:DUF7907 domain-containing protein n=1 Tax=Beauveria bassiana D1-5 TaxID=1245745 RepID=A0A0A2VB40_BEABA|nr:hypothetical protein BBAD15_g11170 [Beauveria bassiana D1-5]